MTPNDTQGEPFRLVVTEVTAAVVDGWGLPALAATAGVCSLIMLSSWLRRELRHWLENPKAADQILVPQVLWACLAGSLAFGLVTVAQQGVHPLTVWQTLAMGFWSASLLLAALIDLRSRLLPDRMTLALALFGLALASSVLLLLGLATWRVLVLLMTRRSPRTTSGLLMLPMGPAIAACAWIGPASLLQWPAGLDWVAIVADFAT